jgi:hypothetical protein
VDTPALIHAVDAGHCIATWDRTLIQIWRRDTTEQAGANMCGIARTFAAKHRNGINSLFIVEAASEIPGSGARTNFTRFTRETAVKAACCVVVPEGGGFRPALVRSIVIGLATLLREPFPYKFVGDVDAAIDLLGPHVDPQAGGREGLRRAVTSLRAKIASSTP